MKSFDQRDVLVTGIGIVSSVGQGKADFISGLLKARHNFQVMQRPGRQAPIAASRADGNQTTATAFIGAEIPDLLLPDNINRALLRTASFSAQVALAALHEAWYDASLENVDPTRIGLIIGGSNIQQRELVQTHSNYQDRSQFVRPTYGVSFMDSDLCGICTETFGIKGFAYTLGAASASGQVAVIQGIETILSGQADACIVIGALMDISYWECQGFRSLGAMGSDRYASEPALAARPFDKLRDGFIFGESCGVLVIERASSAKRSGVKPYARFSGWAIGVDANRNPNPSFDGEASVIHRTLSCAKISPADVDYINPHGTGSLIGDETELKALAYSHLSHAYINATKSIIGHGLSAAGIVELIAVILQMQEQQLHPTRNLDNPIDASFNWVRDKAITHRIKNALNLSMGFGGVNTATCLQPC